MPISFSMIVLSSHLVFIGHAPSYVSLLTCLQMDQLAK